MPTNDTLKLYTLNSPVYMSNPVSKDSSDITTVTGAGFVIGDAFVDSVTRMSFAASFPSRNIKEQPKTSVMHTDFQSYSKLTPMRAGGIEYLKRYHNPGYTESTYSTRMHSNTVVLFDDDLTQVQIDITNLPTGYYTCISGLTRILRSGDLTADNRGVHFLGNGSSIKYSTNTKVSDQTGVQVLEGYSRGKVTYDIQLPYMIKSEVDALVQLAGSRTVILAAPMVAKFDSSFGEALARDCATSRLVTIQSPMTVELTRHNLYNVKLTMEEI